MKTCQNCGRENDDAARFCEACGAPVQAEDVTDILQDSPAEAPVHSQPPGDWGGAQACPEPREEAAAQKKSKKGLWIGLGSGLGVLAVAAAVLVILFLNHPLRKVVSAAQKTGAAWSQEMETLENLRIMGDHLDALSEAGTYAQALSLRAPVDAGTGLYLDLDVDCDLPGKQAGIYFMLGVDGAGEFRSQSYLDAEKLYISLPQLWPGQLLSFEGAGLTEQRPAEDASFPLQMFFGRTRLQTWLSNTSLPAEGNGNAISAP